ncbi:MAG: PDZ domain-containing protein, partial [Sulfuricella sp.]|nr:PDZ domain-containing protein [Sulfuricella sp.]
PFIQTDVPVNPGSSGGPLFNLRGEVVGINSQIYSRSGGYMGLSFAIPIKIAMSVADQLRAHGKVTRGRIGVEIQPLSAQLAASFGLRNTQGALIASVQKGGQAEKAGLLPGDVILAFNGSPISDASELPRLIADTPPGTSVKLQIWRKGAARDMTVVAGELAAPPEASGGVSPGGSERLGLVVGDLTPNQKRLLGASHGVLVAEAQGAAALAGIQPGDVILAVNNIDVSGIEQFKKLLAQMPRDAPVALLIRRGGNNFYVPLRR